MKPIKTLKVSISGVRGVVGDTLKPLLLCRFARSFASYLGGGSIVVGRDTRTSGEMVKHAVLAGLLSSGARVIDVGICPVPTIQLTVREVNARGGIAVTASHNPAQWNALKFIKGKGTFLDPYEAEELLSLYHQSEFLSVGAAEIQSVAKKEDAVADHIEFILREIRPALEPRIKVVVDCCNGAGSVMSPVLLRRLGCEVIELNCVPDGRFPRPPEPLPANLKELCQAVRQEGADVGFAQDADADRLAVVSEQGVPVGEDYSVALSALYVLGREPGRVVVNLSTSRIVDDVAAKFSCPVVRTKIGEVNVTERMEDEGAVIGGEGNGGVIYPRVNMARDSFVAMTLIVSLLRQEKTTISELIRRFPSYQMRKASYEIDSQRIHTIVEELKRVYAKEQITLLDGLKIDRPEGWIHLRASNTEPVMRVTIEARSQELLRSYEEEIRGRIQELAG